MSDAWQFIAKAARENVTKIEFLQTVMFLPHLIEHSPRNSKAKYRDIFVRVPKNTRRSASLYMFWSKWEKVIFKMFVEGKQILLAGETDHGSKWAAIMRVEKNQIYQNLHPKLCPEKIVTQHMRMG
jgi:hypothetical protein